MCVRLSESKFKIGTKTDNPDSSFLSFFASPFLIPRSVFRLRTLRSDLQRVLVTPRGAEDAAVRVQTAAEIFAVTRCGRSPPMCTWVLWAVP